MEYRIPLYIIYGLVSELLFTAIADLINPNFLKSWNVFDPSPLPLPLKGGGIKGGGDPGRMRNPKAIGYSFLWMLPIYALLALIEPAHELMKNFPIFIRGFIYVLALWSVEYISGALIKKISGRCPWDYSASRWNLSGFIRLDFLPVWFVFVLTAEWLSGKFILLTPAIQQVFG